MFFPSNDEKGEDAEVELIRYREEQLFEANQKVNEADLERKWKVERTTREKMNENARLWRNP